MERPICLIKDINELTGSNYFEIFPGEYTGNCWNPNSVFFDEEVFTLIEKPFEDCIPKYDHYSFVQASKENIDQLIASLKSLSKTITKNNKQDINNSLCWMFTTTYEEFIKNYKVTINMLRKQISKENLETGRWYIGRGRNGNVALWDGAVFLVIGEKFEKYVIKSEHYYTATDGCFQPFLIIDEGRMIEPFEKVGWDRHYGATMEFAGNETENIKKNE